MENRTVKLSFLVADDDLKNGDAKLVEFLDCLLYTSDAADD